MRILRAYKTEVDLNNVQKTVCGRHAGAARWTYNWGLARKMEAYRNGEKVPSAIDLHRELNVLKQGELSWMYGAPRKLGVSYGVKVPVDQGLTSQS